MNNENVDMVGMLSFAEPMRVMAAESQLKIAEELLRQFQGNFGRFFGLKE